MQIDAVRPWLMLRGVPGLGAATFYKLIQTFGSPDRVLSASFEALASSGTVGPSLARAILQGPGDAAEKAIDRELERLVQLKLRVVTLLDTTYPSRLKTIPDPPPFLYVSGEIKKADDLAVAIVGSRKATAAGRVLTEELSRSLAARGFTIVSGMARGIDAAAHRGALSAEGRTIAVLGCGIDRTYPPEHDALRRQIESSGAVVSELPLAAYPHAYHFPKRNRIISGMCMGVVVTEATMQSGSLITARSALDQGREVFAVPGNVKAETSRGSNALLKQGAKLVETAEDILDELLPQLEPAHRGRIRTDAPAPAPSMPVAGTPESLLLGLLAWEPVHIDDLIGKSALPAAEVSGLLLSMELRGLVRQLPGPSYIRL